MAAGPRRIALEMLEEVSKMRHALGFAPGADLFRFDDWQDLSNSLKAATDVLRRILRYSPTGSTEQVRHAMDAFWADHPNADWEDGLAFARERLGAGQASEELEVLERIRAYLLESALGQES